MCDYYHGYSTRGKGTSRGRPIGARTCEHIQRCAHCLLHAGLARDHIKHGRVLTSPGVLLPALYLLASAATDAVEKANNLSGIMRVAAMDAVMLSPSLVLYPHEKEACNT